MDKYITKYIALIFITVGIIAGAFVIHDIQNGKEFVEFMKPDPFGFAAQLR